MVLMTWVLICMMFRLWGMCYHMGKQRQKKKKEREWYSIDNWIWSEWLWVSHWVHVLSLRWCEWMWCANNHHHLHSLHSLSPFHKKSLSYWCHSLFLTIMMIQLIYPTKEVTPLPWFTKLNKFIDKMIDRWKMINISHTTIQTLRQSSSWPILNYSSI